MRTIAHLSDLHFGRHDPAVAEALAASLREMRSDLTVVSGDLTQRARRRQFAAARAFLDGLPPPVLAVPGNHDVPLYDVFRRFLRPLARYRRYIAEALMPFYADAEIAVLGINTARSAAISNGRISREQAAAIRRAFSGSPPQACRILVAHHPLLAPPDRTGLAIVGRAAMALEAAGEAGVHLVLCGHYHHAFAAELAPAWNAHGRSLLIVEAGTAISLRRRDEPNSYNLIRIERDRVSCAVQAWNGTGFAPAATAEYAFAGGRWRRRACGMG